MLLLLLEDSGTDDDPEEETEAAIGTYRRVGICNTIRQLFFALAEVKTLILV